MQLAVGEMGGGGMINVGHITTSLIFSRVVTSPGGALAGLLFGAWPRCKGLAIWSQVVCGWYRHSTRAGCYLAIVGNVTTTPVLCLGTTESWTRVSIHIMLKRQLCVSCPALDGHHCYTPRVLINSSLFFFSFFLSQL